jgi:hypothetical protein
LIFEFEKQESIWFVVIQTRTVLFPLQVNMNDEEDDDTVHMDEPPV